MDHAGDEDRQLRAKYHDWCSARVADRFLELSPEEIFGLAEEADRASGGAGSPTASAPFSNPATAVPGSSLSYREMVQRVTSVLVAQMGLPTFEQWLEAYRADPSRIERELWESGS